MSFTVSEARISRTRETGPGRSSVELTYILTGTGLDRDDDEAAETALLATAPSTWGSLFLESSRVEDEGGDANIWRWRGTVRYAPNSNFLIPGQTRMSFNTAGGTQHIVLSRELIASYPSGAPDFGKLIGVQSGTSEIQGTEIVVPVFEFEITTSLVNGDVNNTYIATLLSLTGTTNNASFHGLNTGECLFLGTTGNERGDGLWDITHKFAGKPNRTSVPVGSITVTAVKGWEYLWAYYQQKTLTAGTEKVLASFPKYAYVERVYDSGDFSLIGV